MNKGKVGEWVRHTSSSGKEYYFHVTKQISQWEKPREWIEYEKKHGPVPNTPSSSSAKPNPNKLQQSQQHHQQQSNNASANHTNSTSTSSADQRDRDRKAHIYQHQHGHQQQQQHHYNTSHNSTTNSTSTYASTSAPMQHQQPVVASSSSSSVVHHHSHVNANNNRPSNAESTSSSSQQQQHLSTSSYSMLGRNSNYNDVRNSSAAAMAAAAALRDTRKPSEDLQAEDMDISPLEDSNSPVSTDSKSLVGLSLNSHAQNSHPNSQGFHYQSQYHQHYPNSKNLQDGSETSREDAQRNSAFHHQHPNSGRLIHSGSSSSIGNNNGYHGRDRERDMRDSPRRLDNRDSRDYNRDKDNREYRDCRDYRDKDSRDRDRDRLRRDRETRDSPRRHDRERNDRDRDHRGRPRDRNDHRDRLRNRSGSKLRDERSRSPRDRDGTPERHPGGDAAGVSGLMSLGALAPLNTDTETPALPASLAQYFRQDLIAHVQDLPGDELERQANKLSDEIMTTSAIQLSKVSAELKMARSLVRLTDIQATLQEQRILFLRQQIKNLEESDRDNSSMLGVETGDS